MKNFLILLASNAVGMILACMAFWMVMHDKPNYGWVIGAAMTVVVYPKKLN